MSPWDPPGNPRQCDGVPFAFQELCRQQRSFQALDQECTQMRAKLTQELQQAKNTRNMLQAELDKVGAAHLLPPLRLLYHRRPGVLARRGVLPSRSFLLQPESRRNLCGSGSRFEQRTVSE